MLNKPDELDDFATAYKESLARRFGAEYKNVAVSELTHLSAPLLLTDNITAVTKFSFSLGKLKSSGIFNTLLKVLRRSPANPNKVKSSGASMVEIPAGSIVYIGKGGEDGNISVLIQDKTLSYYGGISIWLSPDVLVSGKVVHQNMELASPADNLTPESVAQFFGKNRFYTRKQLAELLIDLFISSEE